MPTEEQRARAREAARVLEAELDLDRRNRAFADRAWAGRREELPALHLEDVSAIPFVSVVPGVEEYQHRARVRAGDGDLFVAVTPQATGYEAYCSRRLGLGSPEFLLAEGGEHGYAVATACFDGQVFERLVARAREAGGLRIHPYMAIEEVWELAGRIAAASSTQVEVIGPPPPTLWLANDKNHFTSLVRHVLSDDWVVETHTSRDPREMVEHLIRLAEHHAQAGLKRTRCASAMGNAVYDLRTIAKMDPADIVAEVQQFLERTEWALDEEVLIVAWEETDDSPSTQLWIPPQAVGAPIVEGVYEQLLEGEEKIFLGSRPSTLPREINEQLVEVSTLVGTALQSLGYTGRCSFDFILVGEGETADRQPRFVECNGRWGGTSTPMRLVDRLTAGKGGGRPAYRAQDFMHRDLVGVGLDEILERVGDAVYNPAEGSGRYVFYNVGPLARTGKLDVIAFGSDAADADRALTGDLPRRLGLTS